jgi:hypothetical protein
VTVLIDTSIEAMSETLKTPKKKKKKIVSGENLDICNPVLTESTQICNCI